MNPRSLGALVALNLLLLAGLVLLGAQPPQAHAQIGGRAEYLMVSGSVTGRPQQDAIYIFELNTARMAAVFWNGSDKKLELLDGREMSKDFEQHNKAGGRP